ncbi:piggyBac transposable element-derived protein 3-like isoform X2 [Eriocheir sinensis]|nr:piggyBac transposable element-derived protein 3-like isoform X2 [Eriocheir sinensis]
MGDAEFESPETGDIDLDAAGGERDQAMPEDRIGNESITDETIVLQVEDLEVIQDPSTLPPTSSHTTGTRAQASKPSRRLLWNKVSDGSPSPMPTFIPSDAEVSNNSDSDAYLGNPVWYFKKFFTPEFLDSIVYQSNLYASQKNVNKPLNLTRDELEQWLGLLIHFTIIRTPQTRLHWSGELFGRYRDYTAMVMSRNRWETIKSNLHIRDNNDDINNDKLFKVRPMLDHLRKEFQKLPMQQNICIDEQMVPFKGRHQLKQYLPMKPKKWGFKIFVLADSGGLIHDFIPYTGSIQPLNKKGIPDLGASSNIVLHLAETIRNNSNHVLYFDNWFTSAPLVKHLADRGIWCCGTVRPCRLPGLKLSSDADMKKKGRGTHEEWKSSGDDREVTVVKWLDNKGVTLLSTFANSHPSHTAQRYDKTMKKVIEIPQPNIVKLYNKNMGGVDLADCLLSLYRIPVRSKKYYHKLVFHMIDMTINQAWLMYRRDYEKNKIPLEKRHSLLSFRMSLSESLIKAGKYVPKRGRPSSSPTTDDKPQKKRKQLSQVRPQNDLRLDKIGHFPEVKNPRLYCKRLGCKGRTNIRCIKCNVNLCLNDKNNCFLQFHT